MDKQQKIITVCAIALVFAYFLLHPPNVSPDDFEKAIRASGPMGPALVVASQVLASVFSPIPNSLLTLASGRVYGGFYGGLYAYIGGLLGAAATFWIGRQLGRDFVARFVHQNDLDSVDGFIAKYGVWAIIGGRLLPFMSFDAISYAAGMTSMDFGAFMLASVFGTAPGIFAYAYLGEYSRELDFATIAILAVAAIVLFAVASKMYEWHKGRKMKSSGNEKRKTTAKNEQKNRQAKKDTATRHPRRTK
ncbi:MAG: TVP38/TMEM64 family protein [Candidatus Micrarchaeia archaeon]